MSDAIKLTQQHFAGLALALNHLHEQAHGHVEDMVDFFTKKGGAHMEFCAARWREIVRPPIWPRTQELAFALYPAAVDAGQVKSGRFVMPGQFGHEVLVSVAPSRGDDHMLASFPEADYRVFLREARQEFRKLPDWESRDFVHWMFLWDADGLDLHLFYNWSVDQQLVVWGMQIECGQSPEFLPLIVPEDLIDLQQFNDTLTQLLREEMNLYVEQRDDERADARK